MNYEYKLRLLTHNFLIVCLLYPTIENKISLYKSLDIRGKLYSFSSFLVRLELLFHLHLYRCLLFKIVLNTSNPDFAEFCFDFASRIFSRRRETRQDCFIVSFKCQLINLPRKVDIVRDMSTLRT